MNLCDCKRENGVNNEELILKAKNGDADSQRRLFINNIPLIKSRVSRLKRLGIAIDEQELFSEGCVALQKAYNRYDPSLGCKFITLLTRCVENELNNYIRVTNRMKFKLYSEVSFDKSIDDEHKDTYHDVVTVEEDDTYYQQENKIIAAEIIERFLKYAKGHEKAIFQKMYIDGLNMSETGREIGLSRERIRQLHNQIINKIRGNVNAVQIS